MDYSTVVETITICFAWALIFESFNRAGSIGGKTFIQTLCTVVINIVVSATTYLWAIQYIGRITAWAIAVIIFVVLAGVENRRGYKTDIVIYAVLSYITSLILQVLSVALLSFLFLLVLKTPAIVVGQILKSALHATLSVLVLFGSKRFGLSVSNFATRYALGILLLSGGLFVVAYEFMQGPYVVEHKPFNQFALVVAGFCYAIAVCVCLNERRRKREIDRLHNEVKELSAKIHAAKETIPAYRRRLEDLKAMAAQLNQEELSSELSDITSEFAALSEAVRRKGQKEYLSQHPLSSTGLKIIDAQLENEKQDAAELGIEFDCSVSTPLNELVQRLRISVPELQQILGDLISNAIRQSHTTGTKHSQVELFLGDTKDGYTIQVYDAAAHFNPEILARIGERGATTNGTGNGLADILETLTPYQASLVIEEYAPDDDYTKSVSVIFDGLSEIRIIGSDGAQTIHSR